MLNIRSPPGTAAQLTYAYKLASFRPRYCRQKMKRNTEIGSVLKSVIALALECRDKLGAPHRSMPQASCIKTGIPSFSFLRPTATKAARQATVEQRCDCPSPRAHRVRQVVQG